MQRNLEIASISYFWASSPESHPIEDATHRIGDIRFLVSRIETASGVRGEGYLLAFDYSENTLLGALRDNAEFGVGRDVSETGLLLHDLKQAAEYFGIAGVQSWAIGVLNLAMWDAWARSLDVPIWKLFGVQARRVPLYGSGGWLSYSIDELVAEASSYVKRGFRAVKVKVGGPATEQDVERIAKVREAVGPHVRIMMDANQGLGFIEAVRLARAVREYDVYWFEEPLPRTDFEAYAKLRKAADCALAMGEREYNLVALRELSSRHAIDLWQPDIIRLGGVEAWRTSAAAAETMGIPVLPHFYKEYDVPLLCTIPNGYGAESFDWTDGLIDHPIEFSDGYALPTDRPGWGFSFVDRHLTPVFSFGK